MDGERSAGPSNESDWHNSRIIINAFMSCCSTGHPAESSTKMSFTIIKNLEQLPSYPMLCKLAEQNSVRVTGDERTGSFSGHGMEGDYKFGDDGIHGKFAGHGVTGTFSFEIGKATVTIADKPFWMPETLLKQKITDGLAKLWDELA